MQPFFRGNIAMSKNQEPKQPIFSWPSENIIRVLTEPADAVQDEGQRSQARLLASLLAAFIPLAFLSIVVQLFTVPGFTRIALPLFLSLSIIVAAYLLSRTRHYKIGAVIAIAIPVLSVFVNIILDPANTDTLFFLMLSIMLSSLLLTPRWIVLFALISLLGMVGLMVAIPEVGLSEITPPTALTLLMTGLIVVFVRHRDSLEQTRQAALAKSENRWRMLVSQSPFSTVIYSPDGRTQTFNQAAIELWGLSPDDLEYMRTHYNILEDEQLEKSGTMPYIRRAFAGEATVAPAEIYEYQRMAEDGSLVTEQRWIAAHCYPVKDDAGKVDEVVLIHEDITSRVQAEEALRQREVYFRSLIENAMDIVTVLNGDGTMRFHGPAVERFLGYSPDELVGRDVFDFVHPDDLAFAQNFFQEWNQQSGPAPPVEFRFRHKNGSWRVLEVLGNTMLDEPVVAGIVLNSRDITERKTAEEALKLSESRATALLEAIPDMMFRMSREGVYLDYMAEESDLYVPPGEKIIGRDVTDIVPPELASFVNQKIKETLASGSIQTFEYQLNFPGRGTVDYEARMVKSGTDEVIVIVRDITESKRLDEVVRRQERLSAVGQLAAGIAHDFNNVLAVITLYADVMLNSGELSESEYQKVETIRQQAIYAGELTGQILDFSRQSVMETQPVNLRPYLIKFVNFIERTLPENINIYLEHGAGDFVIHADLTRIEQVIMNLALNARDAMPDGGDIVIRLDKKTFQPGEPTPSPEIGAGDWVILEVSDSGSGISPDVMPHLFEPFFTTKEPGQGTGLGLAQVYGIVKQHEGFIFVDSQAGSGSTFTLLFPEIGFDKKVAQNQAGAKTLPMGNGELILIVEDNDETRKVLVDGLEFLNYRVVTARNGLEALDKIDKFKAQIELMVCNLVMPEMGGIVLLEAVSERGIDLPVLMLTGYLGQENLEQLRSLGVEVWLVKPVQLDVLAAAVDRLVGE